ncbi:hypothetical protein KFE26_21490 [Shewanella sp. M16]|uniref:VirB4 family type IV secretion/conjugal transfer ATPase n=1 Tax=Shewanella sp. M16 TaxID=2830837 RepID=UPI001BB0835F|nr:hypothetical protein [Shewanella sp. M16]MBS0044844.1 hypothetical protein [Shewanella sp. M16]
MSVNGLKTIPIINQLPKYGYPISRNIVSLDDSRIMATVCLNGMPFESESESELDQAFNSVKGFLNQLAKSHGSNMAVWTHIIKTKDELKADYSFDSSFMTEFSAKYLESFKGQRFFKTNYYLTFVLKVDSINNGVEVLNDILKLSKAALGRFDLSILEVNENTYRNEPAEFLSFLLNGTSRPIALGASKLVNVIGNSDWHFGYDLLEIRNADSQSSKYATFYEVDSFPISTEMGMWDFILKQQCEFILTQSIILMKGYATLKLIDKQVNLLSSASDKAEQELEELSTARNYVASGEVSFGDYHASLVVFGDTQKSTLDDGADMVGEFMSRSMMFKRANLKSIFTFLSILPASKIRVMSSPRTTTNLVCGWSLHNYSQGKATGNPIGDGSALLPLKSVSDTLFYLNCHASELNKDVKGQKYAGHTMLLGASGAGKTTLEGVITGYLTRFNPQIFSIDYNRSTELFIRAFGGEYFVIREGSQTGLNPFQLNDSPELRGFLNRLTCRICADNDGNVTEDEEVEIFNAIEAVMRLDILQRSLSMVLQSISTPTIRTRLSKWCRSEQGQLSWCLDAPINKFNPASMDRVGFDSTMLLEIGGNGKTHPASEPILAVLFFLKDLMQREGRLMLTIVEEFWMPANFPLTQSIMKRVLKAGRLKNEFMILSSQSPEDAIHCDIFPAIVQQTATKIFLPNPDAEFDSYKRCNVTKGEFEKLKMLDKASRTFLVKQSNTSCFAKLDLFGFDKFLPIISGSDDVLNACDNIRAQHGNDPEIWIPKLQEFLMSEKEI